MQFASRDAEEICVLELCQQIWLALSKLLYGDHDGCPVLLDAPDGWWAERAGAVHGDQVVGAPLIERVVFPPAALRHDGCT